MTVRVGTLSLSNGEVGVITGLQTSGEVWLSDRISLNSGASYLMTGGTIHYGVSGLIADNGSFVQEGGDLTVLDTGLFADEFGDFQVRGGGTYTISGGSHASKDISVYDGGRFQIVGDDATISSFFVSTFDGNAYG
mgnify:CR=1 FL=1